MLIIQSYYVTKVEAKARARAYEAASSGCVTTTRHDMQLNLT